MSATIPEDLSVPIKTHKMMVKTVPTKKQSLKGDIRILGSNVSTQVNSVGLVFLSCVPSTEL